MSLDIAITSCGSVKFVEAAEAWAGGGGGDVAEEGKRCPESKLLLAEW